MIEEKRWEARSQVSNDYDLALFNTGNLPDFPKLTELSRDEWDKLVNQFINTPAQWTQCCVEGFRTRWFR